MLGLFMCITMNKTPYIPAKKWSTCVFFRVHRTSQQHRGPWPCWHHLLAEIYFKSRALVVEVELETRTLGAVNNSVCVFWSRPPSNDTPLGKTQFEESRTLSRPRQSRSSNDVVDTDARKIHIIFWPIIIIIIIITE